MKSDLFRRYVWLVDIVRHAKKVQFEEIADLWLNSVLNEDGTPFALRTFHNHRHAIENLFGIRIECDRSDHHRYYISELPSPNHTRLKEWMLQRLSYSDIDKIPDGIASRIILDTLPEDKFGLYTIIEGITRNRVLSMSVELPASEGVTDLRIAPYCVKYRNCTWYLVGKDIETGGIYTFSLECINSLSLSEDTFEFPEDFSANEYYCNSAGAVTKTDRDPVSVKLKISGPTRDKVRRFPLHESQREVEDNDDASVFEYFIVPTDDFHSLILSHGADTEVIHPPHLRDEIKHRIKAIANRYESE